MSKRDYTLRKTAIWYDPQASQPPLHNSKHPVTKKYWNQFSGTWCSKKSKKQLEAQSSVTLYDFFFFPIAAIKAQYGPRTYQRVALFLTKQYRRQHNGYAYSDWDFVYWGYHQLELYLGYQWQYIVDQLAHDSYIEVEKSASRYNRYKHTTSIKLHPSFASYCHPSFTKTTLTDARLVKSIQKHYRSVSIDRKGILKTIEQTLDDTALQIDDLPTTIQTIWQRKLGSLMSTQTNPFATVDDQKKATHALQDTATTRQQHHQSLQQYYSHLSHTLQLPIDERRAEYHITVSDFGKRISHLFSNTPKEMRRHITIDSMPVVEVDIAASQPTFLYVMFTKWYRSVHKDRADAPLYYTEIFEALAKNNIDFYRFMALKLKGIAYIHQPNVREEMKALFFRLVFGNPAYPLSGSDKKEVIAKAFGHDFYRFISQLSSQNLDNPSVNRQHKNLAHLLQTEESNFLLAVMDKLAKQHIPFLPLYDSLIVQATDRHTVVDVFHSTAVKWGSAGIIKTK